MKVFFAFFALVFPILAQADHDDLVEQSRRVTQTLQERFSRLSAQDRAEIHGYFDRITDIAMNGSSRDLVCLESTQQAGKFCIKSLSGGNDCLGNYFSSGNACRSSLGVMRRGIACYESKDTPGKALIAKVESSLTRIGNYYSSLANCTGAMGSTRENFVCMESERYGGKWLIGNMDQNGDIVGPYFTSFNECRMALTNRP